MTERVKSGQDTLYEGACRWLEDFQEKIDRAGDDAKGKQGTSDAKLVSWPIDKYTNLVSARIPIFSSVQLDREVPNGDCAIARLDHSTGDSFTALMVKSNRPEGILSRYVLDIFPDDTIKMSSYKGEEEMSAVNLKLARLGFLCGIQAVFVDARHKIIKEQQKQRGTSSNTVKLGSDDIDQTLRWLGRSVG